VQERKVEFIRWMKAEKGGAREKSGVHKVDESQKRRSKREKWCS